MAQLGKRMVGAIGIALVCALSMPLAQASSWNFSPSVREGGRQENFQEQKGNRQAEQGRQNYRREDSRDAQRGQRLSPEERQQLRRDIKDAGRELYRPRR